MWLPLPAVGVARKAVVAIGYTIAVKITVLLVPDAVAVEVTVRTITVWLAHGIVLAAPVVDVGNAIVVAIRATSVPLLPAMVSTLVIALIVDRRGRVEQLRLHIHRRRLHIDTRNLKTYGKEHVVAGLCR